MPHLRSSVMKSSAGFDRSNNLLVLPIQGSSELLLACGDGLDPVLEGNAASVTERTPSKAESTSGKLTDWERSVGVRVFSFRGLALGSATFTARTRGTTISQITPLTIRVTTDKDHRQAGTDAKGQPVISADLRLELGGMKFRDALVRLATDQMNSAIGREPKGGFGCYGLPAKDSQGHAMNWCGAFVHWLYARVSEIQGVRNPFADGVHTLASPQKAIGYALHRPDDLTVLEFEGTDPYGWSWPPLRDKAGKPVGDRPALKAAKVSAVLGSGPPRRGDVCLVRQSADPASGWKHVSMVLEAPDTAGRFVTFDGNQGGAYNPTTGMVNGCIGINDHDIAQMAKSGGVRKFAFIAVKLPGDDSYAPAGRRGSQDVLYQMGR